MVISLLCSMLPCIPMLFPFFLPPLLRRQPNAAVSRAWKPQRSGGWRASAPCGRLCQNSPLPGRRSLVSLEHVTGEAQRVRGVDRGLYSIADLRAPACPELHGPPRRGRSAARCACPVSRRCPWKAAERRLRCCTGLPWGVQVRSPSTRRGPPGPPRYHRAPVRGEASRRASLCGSSRCSWLWGTWRACACTALPVLLSIATNAPDPRSSCLPKAGKARQTLPQGPGDGHARQNAPGVLGAGRSVLQQPQQCDAAGGFPAPSGGGSAGGRGRRPYPAARGSPGGYAGRPVAAAWSRCKPRCTQQRYRRHKASMKRTGFSSADRVVEALRTAALPRDGSCPGYEPQ